jgi:prevent-host-death family protein
MYSLGVLDNGASEMTEIEAPATEARAQFSELLNRAAYAKERVAVTRQGKRIAALVPVEDLALLEALDKRPDLKAALTEAKMPKRRK